jgi:hypothetical protein
MLRLFCHSFIAVQKNFAHELKQAMKSKQHIKPFSNIELNFKKPVQVFFLQFAYSEQILKCSRSRTAAAAAVVVVVNIDLPYATLKWLT